MADIIFIGTNHSDFIKEREYIFQKVKSSCFFVDIWNVLNRNKIFFQKKEML
jgi:hypothetical protein